MWKVGDTVIANRNYKDYLSRNGAHLIIGHEYKILKINIESDIRTTLGLEEPETWDYGFENGKPNFPTSFFYTKKEMHQIKFNNKLKGVLDD